MAQRHITLEGFEGNIKVDKSTKGMIHADFKITQNGSYQVHLDKGITLYIIADVSPCRKCQLRVLDLTDQIASSGMMEGTNTFSGFRPLLESPTASQHTRSLQTERVNHGFEESGEVNHDKAQMVCSDSFKPRRR